ncbi:MSH2 protein, partial [Dimargaris xerosporica]
MSAAAAKDRPSLDLDNRSEQGFCAFFHGMPEKMANTVRLFERASGEFYSVHGDDALFVARQIYKTNSVLKYLGGDQTTGLPSCTMSRMVAETFLREALLVQQLRIEIWVSDAKRSQTSSLAGSATWRLGPKASPGNLQELEDILFANSEMTVAPLVASIQLTVSGNQPLIGVAFADATQRYLGLTEFLDNDLYSNLESLLIQLGIRECLLPIAEASKTYDLQKVQAVLTRCNIVATECRRSDFQTKNIDQDLNRLLEDETPFTMRPEYDLKIALGAAACLLKYLALLADESNFGRFRLFRHELSQYMRLDASALRALNLMPSQQLGAIKTMSLFGLLNHCKTSQGARLLNQWIKQPLLQLDPIRERQTLVQVFVEDPEMLRVLQEDHLRAMPDLNRLAKKFQSGRAQLQDVVRVYQCVVKLPGLSTVLGSIATETDLLGKWYLGPLEQNAEHLGKLQELVETMIDLSRVDQHEYHIKPDFDPTLADLQGQMQAAMDQIVVEQRRVSELLHMEMDKKLKLEKSTLFGYCLRLTRTEANCLRNKRSQYIELSVQKGGVLFTTTALKALNQDYRAASDEYQKVQSTLVKEVLGIVGTYCT